MSDVQCSILKSVFRHPVGVILFSEIKGIKFSAIVRIDPFHFVVKKEIDLGPDKVRIT